MGHRLTIPILTIHTLWTPMPADETEYVTSRLTLHRQPRAKRGSFTLLEPVGQSCIFAKSKVSSASLR